MQKEKMSFIYGVEPTPAWFNLYTEKTEVNFGGFATVYIYPTEENGKPTKRFGVNDTITYEDLWEQ